MYYTTPAGTTGINPARLTDGIYVEHLKKKIRVQFKNTFEGREGVFNLAIHYFDSVENGAVLKVV